MELVLSHEELTTVGYRILARGEPLSIFFLNANALRRVLEAKAKKVFIRLADGEKKQLVLSRIH